MTPNTHRDLTLRARSPRTGAWRMLRDQSGQAMAEYSTITFFMLIGFSGVSLVLFLPNFMNALNTYIAGIYYLLDAPLP